MSDTPTLFDRVGGRPFFERLTRRFYDKVALDPILAALYPSDPVELERARLHLEMFLVQYWGGPSTYGEVRGHPRLRMRHAPFEIGEKERAAWVSHMTEAVEAEDLASLDELQLLSYLRSSAEHLKNSAN